ncbi:MAG: dipeptidase [Oscillospiraceae bacterium]|nr:dipeptidase [Oscillospiraceae bacterium]
MRLPLFDAHCDTLYEMRRQNQTLARNRLHVDLERGLRYAPWAQFFAIFEFDFASQYALFQDALRANRDSMTLCRTASDAERAGAAGKCAAFLSVEGAELLGCDLGRLTAAHELGVRMVTLTWNHANALSGTNVEETERGLTDLGRQFVRRCGELGVIVDVSHISERGFWDVAEVLDRPFVASHSNAACLCSHSRNLTDAQFLAIVKAGGVAGLNLYSTFVGGSPPRGPSLAATRQFTLPDIDGAIAHVEHFCSLGGEKSVAIGADLDGCDSLPQGIAGIQDMEKLAEGLLRKNYTEALVHDIFYNNLFRVVEEVCVSPSGKHSQ